MSASREKKSRQESLAGGYVDPRTKREKDEQAKDRRSNALYIAIAVIFVIVGIVVTVANSKVIERNADAVTIGNETYTAADVSYFYNTIYSSFVSKNSYYLSVYGLDTSKSLKEQDCPINGSTWYDYFRDQALESLKSYALLAQKAEAEGFDGSEAVEPQYVVIRLGCVAERAQLPPSKQIWTRSAMPWIHGMKDTPGFAEGS